MLNIFKNTVKCTSKYYNPQIRQKRFFWEYVNMMFNKPDPDRLKLGPDRACAEWVLRNGGAVVWTDGRKLADFNNLPPDDVAVPKLKEIDGTNSSISHYGFSHLNYWNRYYILPCFRRHMKLIGPACNGKISCLAHPRSLGRLKSRKVGLAWCKKRFGFSSGCGGLTAAYFHYLYHEYLPVGIMGNPGGCTELQKIVLHNSKYIENRALQGLSHGKDTLTFVQVSSCADVTDAGLKNISALKNLKTLVLYDLKSVENLTECVSYIKSQIPNCHVEGKKLKAEKSEY